MPAAPWTTINPPDPQREYFVLLTFLPLRHYRSIPRFMFYVMRIMGQLKRTPGLIGYSLLAELGRKRFWTLSVWENEPAMRTFVPRVPHGEVMQKLEGKMGHTAFWHWRAKGNELPLAWKAALERRATATALP